LQNLTMASFFGLDPIRQLRYDDRAGVTLVPFLLQPRDDSRIAATFGGLTDDISV